LVHEDISVENSSVNKNKKEKSIADMKILLLVLTIYCGKMGRLKSRLKQ
jgi:hypothetical protein